MVVFEKESFSTNRLKQSFITSLATWAGLTYEGDYSIINFILCVLLFSGLAVSILFLYLFLFSSC